MLNQIAKLSKHVVWLAVLLYPFTFGSLWMYHSHDKKRAIAELAKNNPAVISLEDTRIQDPNHPFWKRATLAKICPTQQEFLYTLKSKYYLGERSKGVVMLSTNMTTTEMLDMCK